ncbi:DoxX family protein [Pseudomonas fulva]|nr:DoxX family protein [Pseudomonas fulva]
MENSLMSHKDAYVSLFARLLLSLIFLYSGIGKLIAPEATIAYISNTGLPFAQLGYAAALFVELVLAVALLVGYRTAWVAIGMSIFTLAAALAFHFDFSDRGQVIAFLKNLAICGGLLQVAVSGAGGFSIDSLRSQPRLPQ